MEMSEFPFDIFFGGGGGGGLAGLVGCAPKHTCFYSVLSIKPLPISFSTEISNDKLKL